VFLTIGFCHRWCGSQKQNCTLPRAFATLALPGELLGATRRECLERGPLKDAELGIAHALAAHEQPQGVLGQDPTGTQRLAPRQCRLPTYPDRSA